MPGARGPFLGGMAWEGRAGPAQDGRPRKRAGAGRGDLAFTAPLRALESARMSKTDTAPAATAAVASMTGQGSGSASAGGIHVDAALASVNRKQLEILVALPREFATLEPDVQAAIRARLARGRVTGEIRVTYPPSPEADLPEADPALAAHVIESLRALARANGLRDDLAASHLLLVPDLVPSAAPRAPGPDAVRPALAAALDAALDRLVAFRRREGARLADDLLARLATLSGIRDTIAARAPGVADDYQERLSQRITAALAEAGVPPSAETLERIVRETALFADRADIAEELTRLASHLAQASALLAPAAPSAPAGRTLDFLAQEMGREINTIGSKANDAQIAHAVIAFKAELERFREQVQNIE